MTYRCVRSSSAPASGTRRSARDAIRQLRGLGLLTVLLTGDSGLVAQAVGNQLQVDEVHAELMPHQTQQHVEALQRDGQMVAMIGDGVNDATALVQPTVGAAMGSGTAVAMESRAGYKSRPARGDRADHIKRHAGCRDGAHRVREPRERGPSSREAVESAAGAQELGADALRCRSGRTRRRRARGDSR